MYLQMTTVVENFVTYGAGKMFLSCVCPFMLLQITTVAECLVTFRLGKWLLTCVCPLMLLQIAAVVECLVTFRAGKWLLSCVSPSMPLQFPIGLNAFSHLLQASLLCEPFLLLQITTLFKGILSRPIASLLCETLHVSSNDHCC